ncbi:DUF461 domain-containing protein [Streptomyces fulvorobeus]|uniref:Lipoprotein n=1 Tax=Streptomyces fulvorobeus TaxID=284028 RepID=A0A7J0C7M6_9ACTN|nr:DUF461 domain-containing protein [Streptomyces fulvorobeus]NYE42156.1 hypothetical protein [Streptomyces fulvorobeus]GFM98535.1 hypothetical protein Sfulv_33460 [Streptomyces fulvorobeus]
MSRSLRHGALAATAIVFSIASMSACSAGNDAQTLQVRPDNAATAVDGIKIQNVNVITQPEHGTEGPAVVSALLFNNGTKREVLEAVTLPGSDTPVKLRAAKGKGPVVVPAGGSVMLGGKGNAAAVIEKGHEAARNGDVQPVVFKFSETGDVELGATVVPATSFFEGFGPGSLPGQAKPSPARSSSGSPSGTPTGTATGSASPEAGSHAGESSGASGH